MNDSFCGCGSGQLAVNCCWPVILGQKIAKTAQQLMRSRYTAYRFLRVDYLLESWHSETRPQEIQMAEGLEWTGLEILQRSSVEQANHQSQRPHYARVEFIASYIDKGVAGKMHEISRFVCEQGHWFYVDGQQVNHSKPQAKESFRVQQSKNSLCACGSGKKFKRCCFGKN